MPPHCPIDAIVLTKIPDCKDIPWTKITHMDVYKDIIRMAKLAAKEVPLSEWEMHEYNNAQGQPQC